MLEHRLDISPYSYLRQLDGLLASSVHTDRDEVTHHLSQFAKVEKSMVNGLLADPSPESHDEYGWIDTWHWDFLVGLHSTSTPGYPALTYASWPMAAKKCGLYEGLARGISGVNGLKRDRRERLFPRLIECGFLEPEDDPPYRPELDWHRKMLVPRWPADSEKAIPSGVVKTGATLHEHRRDWFMMPEKIINDGTWQATRSHQYRRVIAALYCHLDEDTYSSVNANHLCLTEGCWLEASDAFLRSCGEGASMEDVAGALSWLKERRRLFPIDREIEVGRPYPAGYEYVTWAQPVACGASSEVALFVPLYLPAREGSA